MKALLRTIVLERTGNMPGETTSWNGPMDENCDYHRSLTRSLIDDMSDEDSWELAIEFGWDEVVAQLGGARQWVKT